MDHTDKFTIYDERFWLVEKGKKNIHPCHSTVHPILWIIVISLWNDACEWKGAVGWSWPAAEHYTATCSLQPLKWVGERIRRAKVSKLLGWDKHSSINEGNWKIKNPNTKTRNIKAIITFNQKTHAQLVSEQCLLPPKPNPLCFYCWAWC